MKEIIIAILLVFVLLTGVLFTGGERTIVYDCGMAEWHPDIPPKVKEECRKRALEYWKKEHGKTTI